MAALVARFIAKTLVTSSVCRVLNKGLLSAVITSLIPIIPFNCISLCCFHSAISGMKLGFLNSINGEGKEYSSNRTLFFTIIFHMLVAVPLYSSSYKILCSII